ncbi:hypothetical protein [Brevifollis gellanilyticus]|uniref:Uncharacterized protein n=1 Tax=Brevifollis gellanilyticus TaxID=748831 RepID=A0A512MB16_9BACT|nr:hypothetical protein [Brevifollis gellanilyticus]GEP43920.1 hypothetical protein BGE01nite_32110 [Brevifollis gellanilyticus]
MRERFGNHGTGGVSFFGFQSVITGTVGFIIVLTLFLALCVKDIIPKEATSPQPNPKRDGDLKSMLSTIESLKNEVADYQSRPSDDEATLRRMIGQLTSTIAELDAKPLPGLDRDADATGRDRELRAEKNKLLSRLEKMSASMHNGEKLSSGINKDILDMEKKLVDAQSSLQRQNNRRNVISLIPEKDGSGKEPVLVLVQGSLIRMQRSDGAPAASGSINDFVKYIRAVSPATHYVVLYFKPSGTTHFEMLTKRARTEGFQIGYDVVPEDADIEFSNLPPVIKKP